MPLDLKTDIAANSSLALVIPNEIYTKKIGDIAKQLADSYSNICYVSLNKLYMPLTKSMKAANADVSKFFFIDGITMTAIADPGNVPNCTFVSGPDKLTELGIAIQKTVNEKKNEILLFDSLSTLLVYKDVQIVKQFVHSIVGQVSATGCVAIFTCLEGNTENDLIKDLSMFIDSIIHVTD